ncbi:MAG: ImmA/IrrE family metallo-endopeptidase [Solirubrobacteraceae bacterium]
MSALDEVVRAFDPSRLQLARQAMKLTKSRLADEIQVTSSAVSQYEKGTTRPTRSTLAKLALALRVDPRFFMMERPLPNAGDAHFRSLRSSTKAERAQAVANLYLLWDTVQIIEQHLRLPMVDIPRTPVADDADRQEIEVAASRTRDAWSLPSGPIGHVVRQLEQHGVLVTRLVLASRRLDAFSVELGHRPFVVLGRDKGDAARSRLDAAHELGHLVIHDEVQPGDGLVERQAQQFATAFLMPAEQIAPLLPSGFDLSRLIELKHQWGVSVAALLYRARELRIMSDSTYRRAVTFMSSRGYHTAEPAPLRSSEEPLLLKRCQLALEELGWSLDDLARAVHVPTERLEGFFEAHDDRPPVTLE